MTTLTYSSSVNCYINTTTNYFTTNSSTNCYSDAILQTPGRLFSSHLFLCISTPFLKGMYVSVRDFRTICTSSGKNIPFISSPLSSVMIQPRTPWCFVTVNISVVQFDLYPLSKALHVLIILTLSPFCQFSQCYKIGAKVGKWHNFQKIQCTENLRSAQCMV